MSEKETIKCGRQVFELKDGDTVMDNGACYQLITRDIGLGWDRCTPSVSKAAFKKFKENPKVQINRKHKYGMHVTLYRYTDNSKEEELK